MDTFLLLLRDTVKCAYERSNCYRRLYGSAPGIDTIDDFHQLPYATAATFAAADGITDIACLDDQQLVLELNPFSSSKLPVTLLENEHDMDRRFHRTNRILRSVGVEPSRTAVVCDDATLYFGAEIERVLSWPIVMALTSEDHDATVTEVLDQIGISTLIWATHHSLPSIRASYEALFTFNALGSQEAGIMAFDICSCDVVPWLAISKDARTYDTLDSAVGNGIHEQQFYLERSSRRRLIVTALTPSESPAAVPIVRYHTDLEVDAVIGNTFILRTRRRLR